MIFEMTVNINKYINKNIQGFSWNASAHHATKYIHPVTARPPDRLPRLQRSRHASIFPSTLITFGLAGWGPLRYLSPHLSDKVQGRTFDWTRCALTSLRLILNARTECYRKWGGDLGSSGEYCSDPPVCPLIVFQLKVATCSATWHWQMARSL